MAAPFLRSPVSSTTQHFALMDLTADEPLVALEVPWPSRASKLYRRHGFRVIGEFRTPNEVIHQLMGRHTG